MTIDNVCCNLQKEETDRDTSEAGEEDVKAKAARISQTRVKTRVNPLRPNSDLSQSSHWNIKGLSVSEVMRIENVITQVKFY